MKFSHSLQFNAVTEWSDAYVAYSNLKKRIYALEKQKNQPGAGPSANDGESLPLLDNSRLDFDELFTKVLDQELEKVCVFYRRKEVEVLSEFDNVIDDVESYKSQLNDADQSDGVPASRTQSQNGWSRPNSMLDSFVFGRKRANSNTAGRPPFANRRTGVEFAGGVGGDDDDDDDDDEDEDEDGANETSALRKPRTKNGPIIWESQDIYDLRSSMDQDQASTYRRGPRDSLRKQLVNVYVTLRQLCSFIQLNRTGFTKVLKKYDKIMDRSIKDSYLERNVYEAEPFRTETTQRLRARLEAIEAAYAKLFTDGDLADADRELRLHLREQVVWERNTVWREMIGMERKAQAANIGLSQLLTKDSSRLRKQGDEATVESHTLRTPWGARYHIPKGLLSSSFLCLVFSIATFFVLLNVKIMKNPVEQNSLALLVFVSMLWATEAIPLFVTSLLVPFLVVVLRVVRSDQVPHRRLPSKQAATFIFSSMWSPVIMLLLGGFAIAAALSKHNVAKRMATFVLSKAGTRPPAVLLSTMFVAMFSSMLISNVAAPVLCFSIIQPILRNLPSDSPTSKALILGIALASNIGGAVSPIASPQNLIALENMHPQPGWPKWFFISLPVCVISNLLIWVLLVVTFKPGRNATIVPIRPMKDRYTVIEWYVIAVTLLTIALWCVSHQLEHVFGDMGVLALIPLVLFFGTGVLTKEDFNNFLWTIIMLAAGGLALGKAVNSSGLLHTLANAITSQVGGMSLYGLLVVFAALILVVATFISHTVAALIVLPLVRDVGQNMPQPHPNLLVMGSVLICSAAMGLPTSGFPNMTAIMMEDSQTGQRYLKVKHFISRGVPSSLLMMLVVITVGYGAMLLVGF